MNAVSRFDPRFETLGPLRLVGLAQSYDTETMGDVPRQWARFAEEVVRVGSRLDGTQFGLHYEIAADPIRFDYVTAVPVLDEAPVPPGFVERRLDARRHAVFSHFGHVSQLGVLFHYIFDEWLPNSGHRPLGDPLFFEAYDEAFDASTGAGTIEVWVPLSAVPDAPRSSTSPAEPASIER